MDIKINNIMLKGCVIIAIISLEGIKNRGIAIMINYMQLECVKIAILITIIEKNVCQRIATIHLNKNNLNWKL